MTQETYQKKKARKWSLFFIVFPLWALCNHHWNVWLGAVTRFQRDAEAGHPEMKWFFVPWSLTYMAKKFLKSQEGDIMGNWAAWGVLLQLDSWVFVSFCWASVLLEGVISAPAWFALFERSRLPVTWTLQVLSTNVTTSVELHQICFKKPNLKTFYQRFHMYGSFNGHRGPPCCQLCQERLD